MSIATGISNLISKSISPSKMCQLPTGVCAFQHVILSDCFGKPKRRLSSELHHFMQGKDNMIG